VSYLGGHRYNTDTPISRSWSTQGTRLFLNALFEADCVTGGLVGPAPTLALSWTGARVVDSGSLPSEETYTVRFTNSGSAGATSASLVVTVPAGLTITGSDAGATTVGNVLTWDLGTIAMAASETRSVTVSHTTEGSFVFEAVLSHASGPDVRATHTVLVTSDRDGDGVPDADDPFPDDGNRCGDSDADGCDDCSSGTFDVMNDCGSGDAGPGGTDDDGGCGCRAVGAANGASTLGLFAILYVVLIRRRRRGRS
jgi:MYXO-CTERM domain-containing protein